ncbi:MAG: hypothetical protein Q8O67_15565 [Deltaproteobacteria bacterium]|nr:hypothetical protein [Deltaproteobacteria bacterium]
MKAGVVVVVVAGAWLAPGLAACAPPELCRPGVDPIPQPTASTAANGLFHAAHAHNDYEHERPLDDALAAGFASVEVDVWFRDGGVQVSHDAFGSKGTLDALYLQPLEERLAKQRSVHGDGAVFTLWLDLKDGTAELRSALVDALSAREFLVRYDAAGEADDGAVAVILTGDDASKTAMVNDAALPRPFARDSNQLALADRDDDDVVAVALNFGGYLGSWDGTGEAPAGMARQCDCVVDRAHALGRTVRFFGGPDTAASWDFQLDHGVDFVNADDLAGLAALLADR